MPYLARLGFGLALTLLAACTATSTEDDDAAGAGAAVSASAKRTDDAPKEDVGALDCSSGGDRYCRTLGDLEEPNTGKLRPPMCIYSPKKKTYECTLFSLAEQKARRAPFGNYGKRPPGYGVLCYGAGNTTCEEIDPKLRCEEGLQETAVMGYPAGHCVDGPATRK